MVFVRRLSLQRPHLPASGRQEPRPEIDEQIEHEESLHILDWEDIISDYSPPLCAVTLSDEVESATEYEMIPPVDDPTPYLADAIRHGIVPYVPSPEF